VDLHGGFDGLDITEKEPFRNSFIDDVSTTPYERNNYAYNTIKRAVDSVADPEVSEFNLMLCPGLFYEGLTSHMINVCEDRGDALAIIDLKGDYTAFTETATNAEARKGAVSDVVTNLTARSLNTSYGCAYYPWIQIRDPQQGNYVWVPPSVVALGTFASSEKRSELWFAPAGFRRGGLTEGAAGLPVINVAERLTSADRDKLYAANINPIATFPSEGIVIFGQKTLQVTPSALDRINVRRLMIHVKKEVSRMATQVLFDQNVQATWNRFLSLVKPFLRDIKIKFGLDAFKVVLDETTTTPDLVDRNIMYAKIFLKPTKAIEFIALDFVITNDGAAFED
jgi:phage tail sheath protein FI